MIFVRSMMRVAAVRSACSKRIWRCTARGTSVDGVRCVSGCIGALTLFESAAKVVMLTLVNGISCNVHYVKPRMSSAFDYSALV